MPVNLLQRESIMLKQIGNARPIIEQAPDPGQTDQADADLNAARPVNARQKGILPPPGTEVLGDPIRIFLFPSEEPGGGQEREIASISTRFSTELLKTFAQNLYFL